VVQYDRAERETKKDQSCIIVARTCLVSLDALGTWAPEPRVI
jgi:hypothetical protein